MARLGSLYTSRTDLPWRPNPSLVACDDMLRSLRGGPYHHWSSTILTEYCGIEGSGGATLLPYLVHQPIRLTICSPRKRSTSEISNRSMTRYMTPLIKIARDSQWEPLVEVTLIPENLGVGTEDFVMILWNPSDH